MEKRQIRMQDGRYLIFYTFTDKQLASSEGMDAEENPESKGSDRPPAAKPEAEEERSV
jgi:hypothetical protein